MKALRAHLVFQTAYGEREALIDEDSVFSIGRQASCTLVVLQPSVSRQHARIYCEDDVFHVEDLASSNGTYLNNNRIQSAVLADGDELRCGDMRFIFRIDSGSHAADSTTAPPVSSDLSSRSELLVKKQAATSNPFGGVKGLRPVRLGSTLDLDVGAGMPFRSPDPTLAHASVPIVAAADSIPIGDIPSQSSVDSVTSTASSMSAQRGRVTTPSISDTPAPSDLESKLAKLEQTLAERDRKIAELESKLSVIMEAVKFCR